MWQVCMAYGWLHTMLPSEHPPHPCCRCWPRPITRTLSSPVLSASHQPIFCRPAAVLPTAATPTTITAAADGRRRPSFEPVPTPPSKPPIQAVPVTLHPDLPPRDPRKPPHPGGTSDAAIPPSLFPHPACTAQCDLMLLPCMPSAQVLPVAAIQPCPPCFSLLAPLHSTLNRYVCPLQSPLPTPPLHRPASPRDCCSPAGAPPPPAFQHLLPTPAGQAPAARPGSCNAATVARERQRCWASVRTCGREGHEQLDVQVCTLRGRVRRRGQPLCPGLFRPRHPCRPSSGRLFAAQELPVHAGTGLLPARLPNQLPARRPRV